jgi:hypothetical protein
MYIAPTESGWTVFEGTEFALRRVDTNEPVFMPSREAVIVECERQGYFAVAGSASLGLHPDTLASIAQRPRIASPSWTAPLEAADPELPPKVTRRPRPAWLRLVVSR